MTLYALDGEFLIYAGEAKDRQTYRCNGCHRPVRVRRGPYRTPHFYHLSESPSCRLYSKSEDHLLAQLALQKLLPPGETILEKPFIDLLRVADVVWEPRKIIFEIQCSSISLYEVKQRMNDYQRAGYQLVWILDDRIFNRQILRPPEQFIRQTPSYYATLRKQIFPIFYDQLEIFQKNRRVKKGQSLKVHLNYPALLPNCTWEEESWPQQILQKVAQSQLFFHGDLLHKALLSERVPSFRVSLENFRALEILFSQQQAPLKWGILKKIIVAVILHPFGLLMLYLLERAAR